MIFLGLSYEVVYWMVALLIALSVHEASHALAAYWLGDPTPRKMGRLSLNPFAHIEPLGALMLLLVGFGWGKPVRIDVENLKPNPKVGMALVAIAGPISNILLAALLAIPLRFHWVSLLPQRVIDVDFLPPDVQYFGVGRIFLYAVWMSLALAVFNLIPISPLDGSRLWQIMLPTQWYYRFARVEIYGLFLVIGLVLADQFLNLRILARSIFPLISALWIFFVGMAPPFQM
jgi:Zn-dependent protease